MNKKLIVFAGGAVAAVTMLVGVGSVYALSISTGGTGGVQVSKAGANLVGGQRREDVGVSSHGLRRFSRLNTLVEGPAVGDAAKDARDVDRVVGVAEPREDLVGLARIHVTADVELIPMLVQRGAAGKDLGSGVGRWIQIQHLDSIRINPPRREHVQIPAVRRREGLRPRAANRAERIAHIDCSS